MSDKSYIENPVNGNLAAEAERPVWGVEEIGRVINRTPRQTHYMLASGALKSARKIGGRYCAYPSKLRAEIGG
jgi:hypothetical protein